MSPAIFRPSRLGIRASLARHRWLRRTGGFPTLAPAAALALAVAVAAAALGAAPAVAAGDPGSDPSPLTVHVLSGSNEYRSEESLRAWIEWLDEQHPGRLDITATWLEDRARSIPAADLEAIAAADVLLVFCRRWVLPEDQLEVLRKFWRKGGSVVAIRTASHAFDNDTNREFDREVLGGDYDGHGDDRPAPVANRAGRLPWGEPMPDVGDWATSKLYKQDQLAGDAEVWQTATAGDVGRQVVTWSLDTNRFGGRSFTTSLGTPDDFAAPGFHQMLLGAVLWVADGRDQAVVE